MAKLAIFLKRFVKECKRAQLMNVLADSLNSRLLQLLFGIWNQRNITLRYKQWDDKLVHPLANTDYNLLLYLHQRTYHSVNYHD